MSFLSHIPRPSICLRLLKVRVQFWVVVDNSLRSTDGGGEPLCEEVEWWLRLQLMEL